jgi:hypothetical protein
MQINKNFKSYLVYLINFLFLIVVIFLVLIFIKSQQNNKNHSLNNKLDDISINQILDKNDFIENKTQNFSFLVPRNWYLEKKNGGGIVLYPNYYSTSSDEQKCKIEVSIFHDISSQNMNTWFENYLKKDVSISIKEKNMEVLSLSGADFSFKWIGKLDEIDTAIVYASANNNVYEIVPSVIDIKDSSQNLSCDKYLSEFLNEIKFKK